MGDDLGPIGSALSAAAREADTVTEFTEELSRLVGRWIPHDSYLVSGQDPVTGASCLWLADEPYLAQLNQRLYQVDTPIYWHGSGQAGVGAPVRISGGSALGRPHRLVSKLAHGNHTLGSLTLVRAGNRSFSPEDAARAGALAGPVAQALRRFVAGGSLRSVSRVTTPGTVVLGSGHTILGISPSARDALSVLWPSRVDDRRLLSVLWNSVYLARQRGRPALSRLPTAEGWLAVHAEPLVLAGSDAVAVTVEPARGELLLPVLAAWYGNTPAELGVIRQVAGGLPAKQIARRLDLSVHTVNDHLRSVYRKTGVSGRDELFARLG